MAVNRTPDGNCKQQAEVERICKNAVQVFREVFGEPPEVGAYAPGRVILMDGSIDYSGGPVVPVVGRAGAREGGGRYGNRVLLHKVPPAFSNTSHTQALHLVTILVGRRSPKNVCRVKTLITVEDADHSFPVPIYPSDNPEKLDVGEPKWASYLKGVVALMNKYGDIPPFEVVIDSSVPVGAGLSSSAALEVAIFKFVEQLCPRLGQPDLKQAALLCQNAEHRYANVQCGFMDQFVAMLAKEHHALYIDCA